MQSAEKQIRSSDKQEGVISCFLCLILVVILSLVSVSLESARSAAGRFLAEAYTQMAVNSVLAGYSSVLFERYHIFAYNSHAGFESEIEAALEAETTYYIDRNLQADNKTMWQLSVDAVDVSEYELLSDRTGQPFRTAAVDYMKYRGVSLLVEGLLSSLGIFQNAEKTTKLLETKAKTEEALAEIDTCILQLFESVEGLVRDEDGLKQNLWGKVKVKKHFVKKLIGGTPTAESVQVNHPLLFDALKEHYVDPETTLCAMEGYIGDYQAALDRIAEINARISEIAKEEGFRPDLELEQAALEAEGLLQVGAAEVAALRYDGALRDLQSMFRGCMQAAQNALATLSVIRQRQQAAASQILQYEDELLTAVQWMDEALYEELVGGLATMKQYAGLEMAGEERILDAETMQATLQGNITVLSELLSLSAGSFLGQGDCHAVIRSIRERFAGYSHKGLVFDYSDMKLEAEGESPAESFGELLMGGIAGLVLKDTEAVSSQILSSAELPSVNYGLSSHTEDRNGQNEDAGWNRMTNQGASAMLQSVNEGSPLTGIAEFLKKEGEALTQKLLFLSYLADHFSDYIHTAKEQSVLAYELEYILCGDTEDDSNLYSAVGKILLVRMVFCLIHVLSDSEKCSTAQGAASGLLGFTGLPVLVSVMKFLLLFVWAVEGALVETAAILQGKKVALIPTKANFDVAFSELVLMSKTRIIQKAEKRPDEKGAAFGYREYLMLFLLMQDEAEQNMRTLDLIQENTALQEAGFRVGHMVCSFGVQADYLLPELFLKLPFSKRRTGDFTYRVLSRTAH